MSAHAKDLRTAIDALVPIAGEYEGWTEADLVKLGELADVYFLSPDAADCLDAWFRLFERFPESDAYGVFWTILHGLERFEAISELAVASVRCSPSRFPVMMINRIINSGVTEAGGADLLRLLDNVARSSSAPAGVREDAERFLEYQRAKA